MNTEFNGRWNWILYVTVTVLLLLTISTKKAEGANTTLKLALSQS